LLPIAAPAGLLPASRQQRILRRVNLDKDTIVLIRKLSIGFAIDFQALPEGSATLLIARNSMAATAAIAARSRK
jgi:hypothetical protein